MMLEVTEDGLIEEIPAKYVSRLVICPKRVLDGLPLAEIEEYVAIRRAEA